MRNRAHNFIQTLDTYNSTLSRTVERGLLSQANVHDQENLIKIVGEKATQDLGFADLLRLRLIAISPSHYPEVMSGEVDSK